MLLLLCTFLKNGLTLSKKQPFVNGSCMKMPALNFLEGLHIWRMFEVFSELKLTCKYLSLSLRPSLTFSIFSIAMNITEVKSMNLLVVFNKYFFLTMHCIQYSQRDFKVMLHLHLVLTWSCINIKMDSICLNSNTYLMLKCWESSLDHLTWSSVIRSNHWKLMLMQGGKGDLAKSNVWVLEKPWYKHSVHMVIPTVI